MSKVTVLIALGPNYLEIPCRIVKDVESAHEFCKGLDLEPIGESKTKYYLPDFEVENEKLKKIANKVFTSYYGGCGEAWAIEIREVEFDSAFVGWDLD